jgi:hypothetical protein
MLSWHLEVCQIQRLREEGSTGSDPVRQKEENPQPDNMIQEVLKDSTTRLIK